MDANAYLRKQGWKGSGHSLDGYGRGIKKPLLIAHKQDQLGLGKRAAAHNTDDQWWMRAFDESLQNIGTGQTSTLTQVREKGVSRGGLYGFFVKGDGLVGTITSSEESSAAEGENTSTPPSGASTPPTSASDTDNAAKSTKAETATTMKNKNGKRKRDAEENGAASKKLKQAPSDAEKPGVEAEAAPFTLKTKLGTFDAERVKQIVSLMDYIQMEALQTAEKNIQNGAYGSKFSATSEKSQHADDPSTGKKLNPKAAKMERQKAARSAKRSVVKQMTVAAVMNGDLPNPEGWSQDEAVAKYKTITTALDEVKQAEKKLRRDTKNQQRLEKREVTREEKKQASARLTAEKQAAASAKLAKQNGDSSASSKVTAASKIAKLSPSEKADYEKRAAEKSQTLEEYVQRRIEKKAAKRAAKTSADAQNDEEEEAPAPDNLFVVDLEGDPTLSNVGPNYIPLPDGSCPLDPSIWASQPIKSLPKPVREARRKWMKQQRNDRNIKAGKSVEKGPTRGELKAKNLDALIRKELSSMGIKEGATKEQMNEARRKARKITREEKKEERGKKVVMEFKAGRGRKKGGSRSDKKKKGKGKKGGGD